MPSNDQRLDFRNLPAAMCDSCDDPHSGGPDLLERSTVTFQDCFSAAELLPPHHSHIDISGVDIYTYANPLCQFGRHHRRTGP
jgi:hypothetical protein